MINPNRPPPPGFSLDPRDLARGRSLKRREWRLLVFLPISLAAIAVVMQLFLAFARTPPGAELPAVVEALPDQQRPVDLGLAGPLPDAATIERDRPFLAEAERNRSLIRITEDLDGLTLAWAGALITADAAKPPIPVRVDGTTLRRDLAPGTPVVLRGRLSDARIDPVEGSDTRWARLLLTLDGGDQALVLTPAPIEVVVGHDVMALGRLLGPVAVPVAGAVTTAADGTTASLPLIAARRVDATGQGDHPAPTWLAEFQGAPPADLPAEVFAGISDERAILETRPYYLLLGQTLVDQGRVLPEPPTGNTTGTRIHRDPPAFRGQRFTVAGWVHRAYPDALVARDQPFGITRVWRILAWSRDLDPVEEIDGGRKVLRSSPLRLYEFCVSGLSAPPAIGSRVALTGRFFKFRAIPVRPDPARDKALGVSRQSDKVYSFVYVGAQLEVLPAVEDFRWNWWDSIIVVAAAVLGFAVAVLVRRDQTREARVPWLLRRMRERRRR